MDGFLSDGVSTNDHLGTLMPFGAPSTPSWKRPFSEAEGLSRSAARLRRRAERRVLDSPSAAEVLAAMRSTARRGTAEAVTGECWLVWRLDTTPRMSALSP
jgi:hypothetical protein